MRKFFFLYSIVCFSYLPNKHSCYIAERRQAKPSKSTISTEVSLSYLYSFMYKIFHFNGILFGSYTQSEIKAEYEEEQKNKKRKHTFIKFIKAKYSIFAETH